MNDPNACNARFYQCHCMLPDGHDGPHECVPDPVCGGSWLSHPDDPGVTRIYRYPSNRPGCDAFAALREDLAEHGIDPHEDPSPGEYDTEPDAWDGIFQAPRGGIVFLMPPQLGIDVARAEEERLLKAMRSPDA